MVRYYTDIDFVLHYYSKPFFETARRLFDVEISEEDVLEESVRAIPHLQDGLSYYSEMCGLDKTQIRECVRYNEVYRRDWVPTSFGKALGSFLGRKKEEGHEVYAVTARANDRTVASEVVRQALGVEVPVFSCDTENKSHIINDDHCDKAVYFEDHPIAAEMVSKKFGDQSMVVVPDWPWNRKQISSLSKERKNIILLTPNEIKEFLEKE